MKPDSVLIRSQELVFLSGEVETWEELTRDGAADARFSWLWRLPETLEDATGGLAPESARLTGLPLMRGLNAKRTAVTFDGVPLGHSGLREGPSVIPLGAIDPAVVGGFRVVRGPRAAGASAEGPAGIIDIRSSLNMDQQLGPASGGPSVLVSQRISSADRGWSGGVTTAGEMASVRYRFGGTGRFLGDIRAGSSEGGRPSTQPYSSLSESALHGLASIDVSARWNIRAAAVASWREGQSVVDDLNNLRLSPIPDEITVFDPRRFAFAYVSSRVTGVGAVEQLDATVWFNGHRETRTFRREGWERTVFDDDRLTSIGFRSQATLRPVRDHILSVEADVTLEGVEAVRWEVRNDGSVWGQRGRFPVGTRSRVAAVSVRDSWRISESLAASGDVRFSSRSNHSAYGPSVFGLTGLVGLVERTYRGVSWRAEMVRTWSAGWSLTASAARGFRAPGLDDQAANAVWLNGRDVPNPALDAERVRQVELAGRYEHGALEAGASVFRASYSGLIGRDWFESGPDGVAGTIDDLFRFVNHRPVSTVGVEADLTAGLGSFAGLDIKLSGRLAAHRWSSGDVAAVRHMPPVVGRAGSQLSRGGFWVEPYVRFSTRTRADRFSTVGALTDDTPGWVTLNARGGARIAKNLLLVAAIQNVGNVRYREHGSYLESPGRNLILSASYLF